MQDRVTTKGWTLLLAGALGCGPGATLSLGSEAPLRSQQADAGVEGDGGPSYPPSPEARRCTADVEGQLEIDFQLDVATPICPQGSGCQLNLEQLVPVDDGSLWVRGARIRPFARPDTSHVWLAHISAEGGVIATREIEVGPKTALWNSELAVDDDGQAWLATWDDRGSTRIQRFDASVQPIGAPIPLADWTDVRMANAPGQGIVLIGQSAPRLDRRLTGLLDAEGVLQWTTNEPPVGLLARPVVGPTGEIVVPSAAPGGLGAHYFDDGVERGPTNLQAYASDGTVLWSRDMIREVSGTGLTWWFFRFMGDATGGLTIAASETAALPTPFQGWVLRLSADGAPQWLWQLPYGANTPAAVDPPTGRTFVVSHLIESQGEPFNYEIGTLTVISADGTTCRKYGYTGVYVLEHLASSATGELFFAGDRTVGRFRPIEP